MAMLKDKVAIVTGAGGGLGRCHALALAAQGAKVVVNDPGVQRDGSAGSGRPADTVVDEIKKAGGQAVACYDSVADGADRIIAKAVEAFGRVDILVNNAGILRDKTIHNMTDEMWDAVIAVHLRGTFACTRAAARVMKEKGGGRIINTTSVAGLKGNFGQANYSAAKAGIYGLTLTSAMEFGKDGITVNAIAPIAKTRMTDDIDSIPAEYRPEDVSPVVVFLASDLAKDVTGRILGVHGRHLFEYRMELTAGVEKKEPWTIEEISAFVHAPPTASAPAAAPAGGASKIAAVFKALPTSFDAAKSAGWESLMHFAIPGAGDWGVEVKAQTVKVSEGVPAAPTCVITVDADTMLGMVEGRVKGDMAFMAGKLKATKVPDLGKFGKVFDFKKLKGALESGAAPAAAKAPAAAVDLPALLARLPGQFLPDKAAGYTGTILFKVDGQAATLEIKDKACALRPPTSTPTCTLSTDATTLAGLLEGAVDGQKAMQDGKVKVTHLPSWLKFRQMFRFEPERGIKRALVGRLYTAAPILLKAERMKAFGDVVGDPDSPVFPVTLIKEPFTKLFEDPDFTGDFQRMVHGEQAFTFHRPLKALDLLSVRGRVLSIEDKGSGQLLNFGTKIYTEGELLVEMESRLFFRGESKGAPGAPPPPKPAPERSFESTSAADLPRRYAAVSGDDNPIHLDEALAKSVGFKGVILHGLCTLALVAKQLPRPLKRLEVRFAKPVYPGELLKTALWKAEGGWAFETANPAGEVVLANGRAS